MNIPSNHARLASVALWLLLLVALVLYLGTLDNGFYPEELRGGDLITHQYAQVQARPGNAPGYPLYTMGGWLWFHGWRQLLHFLGNPLPNPIPILSGYSLLWALLSLYLFYQIVVELLTRPLRRPGNAKTTGAEAAAPGIITYSSIGFAWGLTAFYAVTYFFWYYATTTEQYSSAIAQTLAMVYVYLRFISPSDISPSDISPLVTNNSRSATRTIYLLALLSGIALAHMLTVAFIVPPLVLLILWDRPWLLTRLRVVMGAVLAAAFPLLSYFYVYWRGGSHPEWWGAGNWRSANEWFWAFVSTAQGRDELERGFEAWCGPWAGNFPAGIWQELSMPILLLGLIGIGFLGWRLAILFYGTLTIYLIFCWMYRCGNWYQVILPAYPLILLGLVPLYRLMAHWLAGQNRPRLRWLPHLFLLVAIIWRVDASWPQANSRNRSDDTALDRAALLINDTLPNQAALFAPVDDLLGLQYLTQIWGVRTDLTIVDHREARQRINDGQQVLTTYGSTELLLRELGASEQSVNEKDDEKDDEKDVEVRAFSPSWVVIEDGSQSDPAGVPLPSVVLNQSIEPGVELVGYQIERGPQVPPVIGQADPYVDVTLTWRLAQPAWPEGLSISVRPSRDGGFLPLTSIDESAPPDAIIQQDQAFPMQGIYPLSQIPAGQIFADAYRLFLPAADSANEVVLLLYRATDGGFTNVADIRMPVPAR